MIALPWSENQDTLDTRPCAIQIWFEVLQEEDDKINRSVDYELRTLSEKIRKLTTTHGDVWQMYGPSRFCARPYN